MKKYRAAATAVLFCSGFLVLFSGCTPKKPIGTTRTIVDQVGHTVVLPEKIERVVIASVWPLASVYCLAFGTDTLVGLDPAIISAAENSMLIKIAPDIASIPSSFSKNGMLNAEALAALKPDVVLYASGVMEDYDVATQAGIPAVGFSLSIRDYNAVETINSWIELLGQVMGTDMSDSEYVAYGREMEALVAGRIASVKDTDKPAVMFIHKYSDTGMTVPGLSSWADYWISASGGRNVASAFKGSMTTGMEQVYAWNPDSIFITNFTEAVPEDLYANAIGTADWSPVQAVKTGNVRKLPLGMYRWYVTCSDSPLMLLWMAKQNQGELFADIDMEETVRDFYRRFYDLELSDADIERIWTPNRAAAAGIKK
ncbi:ABC transporter substrate-binding protein [Treponema brennaborense]|uniref:ABC-type transporter, periplasmic subunit n=1 Tax=Treponema brennaborense (strain DSM 12168 / CIP 105900 / DD5/3) TaxID=906968 RepID=F4LLI5_TREBD|nr:ABC transporter substrate-binding protein [Treponema brennaborense]AEE16649.1 ABC-type transporter, periplasmic subunit [Treponema brennaborense DSM 12168]